MKILTDRKLELVSSQINCTLSKISRFYKISLSIENFRRTLTFPQSLCEKNQNLELGFTNIGSSIPVQFMLVIT